MMKIVISQPMYFPWIGLFEQIRIADIYIHYNDVQFSKGSFTNRVQIKNNSAQGFSWMTVPLKAFELGAKINEIKVDNTKNWQHKHLSMLSQAYKDAPYKLDMLDIVRQLFDFEDDTISQISQKSIELILLYFELFKEKKIYQSSCLDIGGHGSGRVHQICKYLCATHYITGHGARNYLDYSLFENDGIRVEYVNYLKLPYPQLFGKFNPYVSILDLIANVGKMGIYYICSSTQYWREFCL